MVVMEDGLAEYAYMDSRCFSRSIDNCGVDATRCLQPSLSKQIGEVAALLARSCGIFLSPASERCRRRGWNGGEADR